MPGENLELRRLIFKIKTEHVAEEQEKRTGGQRGFVWLVDTLPFENNDTIRACIVVLTFGAQVIWAVSRVSEDMAIPERSQGAAQAA